MLFCLICRLSIVAREEQGNLGGLFLLTRVNATRVVHMPDTLLSAYLKVFAHSSDIARFLHLMIASFGIYTASIDVSSNDYHTAFDFARCVVPSNGLSCTEVQLAKSTIDSQKLD